MNICACGCGQEIPWKKHHSYRPPKYLHGHYLATQGFRDAKINSRTKPPPDFNPTGFCECGCGQKTLIAKVTNLRDQQYVGYPLRFIHGHNAKGKQYCWKGGRFQKGAHWMVYLPGHHLADKKGYVYEHRLVWEQHNSRLLRPNEHVHHIDGNPSNNDPTNLVALTRKEHLALHNKSSDKRKIISLASTKRFENPETRKKQGEAFKKWRESRLSQPSQNSHGNGKSE